MFFDKIRLILLCVAICKLSNKSSALVVPQNELNDLAGFLEPLMETYLVQARIPDVTDNENLKLRDLDITRADVGSIKITNPKAHQFKVSLRNVAISLNGRFRVKKEVKVPVGPIIRPFFPLRKKRFIGKVFNTIKNVIKKPKELIDKVVDKIPKIKLFHFETQGKFTASAKIDLTVTLKLTIQGGKFVLTTVPNSCDDDVDNFKVRISDNGLKYYINPILSLLRGIIARNYIEGEICETVESKINRRTGTTLFSFPGYFTRR
ncbi:uncharacterized protein LOC143460305 [Clavelina lepadiformis]|uniref:Uncharacterized protein n=1 Tax=Clavelina lepadiformis TaxID=159417 RepID=A0ABP0FSB7_CLALP